MTRSVRIAPRARLDLVDVWEHVAADSVRRADDLLERFGQIFILLTSNPMLGVARDELRPGLRAHAVGNHVAFYRLKGRSRTMEIVRILHGARDITRLF